MVRHARSTAQPTTETTMTDRDARREANRQQALAAFIARKAEIDALLARIAAASADHFGRDPDEVTWADEGSLGHVEQKLREVAEFLSA